MSDTKLTYNKKIRSVLEVRKKKRYYCLNDVIKALTNVKDAKNYLKQKRKRDNKLTEKWGKLVIPIEMDTSGGRQKLMCTDAEGLLLLLQSMRNTEKTGSFKRWLKRIKNR